MYRLVRKFRARVKTQEIALLFVALAVASILGRYAGNWYVSGGRDNWIVASVNGLDGGGDIVYAASGRPVGADELIKYDTLTYQTKISEAIDGENGGANDASGGFFTSAKAARIPSASGYPASLLSYSGAGGSGDKIVDDEENAELNGSAESGGIVDGAFITGNSSESIGVADDIAVGDGGNISFGVSDSAHSADVAPDGGFAGREPAAPEEPKYTVKIVHNGERVVIETISKKVSELFEENGITLSEDDKVSGAYLEGVINSDLYIVIKKIKQKTVFEEVVIPAKTVYRNNADLGDGESNTIRQGADGLKRVEYAIVFEDGVQVGKNVVREEVVKEAVSKIIEQGSSGVIVGKDGVEYKYSKVLDVKCTAYRNSLEDTGKEPGDPAYGITKTGMIAREGVVAVDPNIIPLYTKMYIDILDESIEDYGYAIAGDTGSKIKGKKVDLFIDGTAEDLKQFGVRKAKVYILD